MEETGNQAADEQNQEDLNRRFSRIMRKKPQLVGLAKPQIKTRVERYVEEFSQMKGLEVSGLLGKNIQQLNKAAIVRGEPNILSSEDLYGLSDWKQDGLCDTGMLPTSDNLQRLEQRILKMKQLPYFNKSNWQMRLDSDVTTHYISKPVDISLEFNPAKETKMQSAILSHRKNTAKTKYFRLDLQIGRLNFQNHPQFIREDTLAMQLQQLYYDYEKRVGLCLVDHLNERVESLEAQIEEKEELLRTYSQAPSTTQQEQNEVLMQEISLMRKHLEDATESLEAEKGAIQQGAEELYNKWEELKEARQHQGFTSTFVKLAVREYRDQDTEYDFFLHPQEPTSEGLPASETSRRAIVRSTRVFLRIKVNGVYVARTTKKFLQWPQFSVNFAERFQLHLFNRPVKIELEVCTGLRAAKTLARGFFHPPGLNVNAETSSAEIYKQVELQSEQQAEFATVTLKSYWVGHSKKMPPVRFEDLCNLPKSGFQETEEQNYFIDVNDPRKKALIDSLQKERSKVMKDLLKKDELFPHFKFQALRELLMKERVRSIELVKYPVPLLERDIRNAPMLMRFIEAMQQYKAIYGNLPFFFLQKQKLKYSTDPESKGRMKELMEYFITKQNQIKLGTQKPLHSLETTVREFILIDRRPFLECFRFLFSPRRKLLPKKTRVQAISSSSVSVCKVNITIYKGINIPVRNSEASKRYAQVERFYQPRLPGARMREVPENQPSAFNSASMGPEYPPSPRYSGFAPSPRPYNQFYPYRPPSPSSSFYVPPEFQPIFENVERVQSFVEVRLFHLGVSRVVRTAPFEGTNAEWNQLLELAFESMNSMSFTKEELIDCKSVLYFNLYDQIVNVKKLLMEKDRALVGLERRYLGSFSLPLITVFQNPHGIEASFRVKRPLFIFGYHTSSENPFTPLDENREQQNLILNPESPTYIVLKVSLDPVLELPNESEADYYPGAENPSFLFHGFQWLSNKKNTIEVLKDRRVILWAENSKFQSVFLPRFLCPQEPPPGLLLEDDPDPIAKVVRFVSLIPHVEDSRAFRDMPDVWTSSQEMLDLGFGDYEEHALLLCNYFKWIDRNNQAIQNMIVIGKGVPEGNAIYVLRRDTHSGDVELWNASEGVGYSLKQEPFISKFLCFSITRGNRAIPQDFEQTIGLKSVGCIFDENDIYINIQQFSDPYSIDFNVQNTKNWMPFLGKGGKRNLYFPGNRITTIQEDIKYEVTPERFVQELQLRIEKMIRTRFEEVRSSSEGKRPMITKWNFRIADYLYQLLPLLETFYSSYRIGAQKTSLCNQDPQQTLSRLTDLESQIKNVIGERAYGFPINKSLQDLESLWQEVENTDLQNLPDEDCEFVLSVRVFDYACFVSSVWIYIAAVYRDPRERFEEAQARYSYY